MEYHKFIIRPDGQFGSLPMSDMIFGQLCCILAYEGVLESMLRDYNKTPFAVFSDMLPLNKGRKFLSVAKELSLSVKKSELIKNLKAIKDEKKRNYIEIDNILKNNFIFENLFSETTATFRESELVKNSINRHTGTTDDAGFTPYNVVNTSFSNNFYYTLYAYIEPQYVNTVTDALKLMGSFGFGRDSSTGMGKFSVDKDVKRLQIDASSRHNAMYTLGNMVLENAGYDNVYYEPFTRFGKHGAYNANGYPYKNPIVMARQGALIYTTGILKTPYIGNAVSSGISYHTDTVHQGYSLYIPIEVPNDK